jgi:hypothetical protein
VASLSLIDPAIDLDWLAGCFPVSSRAAFASGMLQCHLSICWRYFLEAVAGYFLKGIMHACICSFLCLFVHLFVHSFSPSFQHVLGLALHAMTMCKMPTWLQKQA